MAHILSVEDVFPGTMILNAVLRGRGHTVDEASDGEEGLSLARQNPYDVIVANLGMPRMSGDEMLDAVPMRPSGLPIRVLQTHGGGGSDFSFRHGRHAHFAVDDSRGDLIDTVQRAIELAFTLVKAHAASANRPQSRGSLPEKFGAPVPLVGSLGPSSEAEREIAVDQMRRVVRVSGSGIGGVRWLPGPLSACRHLLDQWGEGSLVVGRDPVPRAAPNPLHEFPRREMFGRDSALLGLDPAWTAIEREGLRATLRVPGEDGDGGLEALLALSFRGIGVPVLFGRGFRLWQGDSADGSPRATMGLHQIWWWLLEDRTVLAADRPVHLALDRGGAPHSTTGPAIQYADGFEVYALHGRRVDAEIIHHPERVTLASIRACTDAELRRVLRELYGDVRYLTDTGAKLIHMDTVPVDALAPGSASLTRALLEDDEGLRFLVASDGSTSRVYHMRVPRSCTTCAEAYTALSGHPGVKTILEA